ncbi:MAG: protein-glutamate O-methyltransferase CheR [candidate division WS1 bacterium]|jgi:chemotaxis protein methyltransferase CheR|nr:protein-glutamate O-methyltransferase CheR [candidate division WS1 bacterium]
MAEEFFDAEQFERFSKGVLHLWDIDLNSYGQRQLHRRLRFMMERAGDADLDAFLQHLTEDRELSAKLKDQFTINVSEFFRDAHLFARLETMLRPGGQCHGARRVWSAGCSYGAEPYSLAMLLTEYTGGSDWQVIATDIDHGALKQAREGLFSERDVRNVTAARRRKYFTRTDDGKYAISPQLQARVKFGKLDLLKPKGRPPTNCDLVLCRNVIIYFTTEAKQQVHKLLASALRPGGVLLIGATERVPNALDLGLKSISPFFYERQAA